MEMQMRVRRLTGRPVTVLTRHNADRNQDLLLTCRLNVTLLILLHIGATDFA